MKKAKSVLRWIAIKPPILVFALIRGMFIREERKAIFRDIKFFLSIPIWLLTEPDPRKKYSHWTDDHSHQN